MKKRVLAWVCILAVGSALMGCGSGTGGGKTGAPAGSEASKAVEAGTAAAEVKTAGEPEYVMNLGDAQAEDHPHSKAFYWFADRVAELTDGRVKVNVFVNSTLGNQPDLIEGLGLGTVQIAKTMTTGLSVYFPEIQIFDLPYMFESREHLFKVIDGEIGEHYAKDVLAKEDMVGIAYFYAGARSIYSDKKITSLADAKGMKLRVPDSPIFISFCEAIGASGTPMPMGDIYTGIQTGVVDGAENAPIVYYYQKHYEAAKNFNLTEHIITPDVVVMSKSYLESLPQDIQDAIIQAGKELQAYERELWLSEEDEINEKLKAGGAIFNEVDKESFQEASQAVWNQYSDIVGQDMIDKIKALAD